MYNFYAIGNYYPDGSFDSNGIAIFGEDATGELLSEQFSGNL